MVGRPFPESDRGSPGSPAGASAQHSRDQARCSCRAEGSAQPGPGGMQLQDGALSTAGTRRDAAAGRSAQHRRDQAGCSCRAERSAQPGPGGMQRQGGALSTAGTRQGAAAGRSTQHSRDQAGCSCRAERSSVSPALQEGKDSHVQGCWPRGQRGLGGGLLQRLQAARLPFISGREGSGDTVGCPC